MSTAPLDGVTVIECASYISGPYAGLLLAQLGARVVKIEAPGGGDSFRRWGGTVTKERVRPQFAALNYGKESVALDLRAPDDQRDFLELVATADALIENFRPGTMDAFGIGEAVLREHNPELVYVSLTGFGPTGPYAKRPAYDAIVQALSGVWSQLSPPSDGRPVGPALSDTLGGLHGALAVLAGLAASTRNAQAPRRYDVSMLGASLDLLGSSIANFVVTGEVETPHSRGQRSHSMSFVAADGRRLAVHLSSPEKFWVRLTDVLGAATLRDDPRFATYADRLANFEALLAALQEAFSTTDRDQWLRRLTDADVPAAPLYTLDEVLDDPHVVEARLLTSVVGPVGEDFTVPRGAIAFEGDHGACSKEVPALGQQ